MIFPKTRWDRFTLPGPLNSVVQFSSFTLFNHRVLCPIAVILDPLSNLNCVGLLLTLISDDQKSSLVMALTSISPRYTVSMTSSENLLLDISHVTTWQNMLKQSVLLSCIYNTCCSLLDIAFWYALSFLHTICICWQFSSLSRFELETVCLTDCILVFEDDDFDFDFVCVPLCDFSL